MALRLAVDKLSDPVIGFDDVGLVGDEAFAALVGEEVTDKDRERGILCRVARHLLTIRCVPAPRRRFRSPFAWEAAAC